MIVDVVTFNGEYDLFEIRYNLLRDYVDEFRIIEFDKTFSGKDKPQYIAESDNHFYDPIHTWDKVKCYYLSEEEYQKYKELAEQSPNTVGAEHWKREFCQKESIKDCLTDLNDHDLVFIGDCDEIWNPEALDLYKPIPIKLGLEVYTYHLNNKSSEEFWGTLMAKYYYIKDECLNHLRTNSYKTDQKWGWHFTSLKDSLRQKLTDSYTTETYANDWVMDNLQENIDNNKDFLGRNFSFTIDETEWPSYLKDNREKYKHLLKDVTT